MELPLQTGQCSLPPGCIQHLWSQSPVLPVLGKASFLSTIDWSLNSSNVMDCFQSCKKPSGSCIFTFIASHYLLEFFTCGLCRGKLITRVHDKAYFVSKSFPGLFCCCLITQLCPPLCNPMDCSPPGSSVHGISQARLEMEWVAISFSRGSSQPKDQTCVSCTEGRFFTAEPSGKLSRPL